MSEKRIILNHDNYVVLKKLVESLQRSRKANEPHVARLATELKAAIVMDTDTIPDDVVTIHSRVRYRYAGEDTTHEEAVGVFTAEATDAESYVSILSPLGMALIGERDGTEVEYVAPGGTYRIRIMKVEHMQSAPSRSPRTQNAD